MLITSFLANRHFDYISSRRQGAVYVRKNYTVSEYPEDLKNKVYLLKHFEKYIMDKLYGDHDYIFEDRERTHGMAFVQKYLRMKQIIIFKLSNDVIQVSLPVFTSQALLTPPRSSTSTTTRKSCSRRTGSS